MNKGVSWDGAGFSEASLADNSSEDILQDKGMSKRIWLPLMWGKAIYQVEIAVFSTAYISQTSAVSVWHVVLSEAFLGSNSPKVSSLNAEV